MNHVERVKQCMIGYGQAVPEKPGFPSREVMDARVRIYMEEYCEFLRACGYGFDIDIWNAGSGFGDNVFLAGAHPSEDTSFIEAADALADRQVVLTGDMLAFGIKPEPLMEVVDENNLLKIGNGKLVNGKFIKPANHPKPDIVGVLREQGYEVD